jgi:hypothetical protein
MNIKTYREEKRKALAAAKYKLAKMTGNDRLKLALKLGLSHATINSYRAGNANNFETALIILES